MMDESQDSGYSTQSQSLDDASTSGQSPPPPGPQLSSKIVDSGKPQPPRPGLAAVDGLSEFDKPVDEATIARFSHLCSQVEKPLLSYVRSETRWRKYRPIAIRMMILGQTLEDAKPCIVVLCMEHLSKKVRKFFDNDSIKALCQPNDETLSPFEVYVVGQSPETKQGDEDVAVFAPLPKFELSIVETYCGLPILVEQLSGTRRCTFGGLIKVNRSTYPWIYGLTVGHILFDEDYDSVVGVESSDAGFAGNEDPDLFDSASDSSSCHSTEDSISSQPMVVSAYTLRYWTRLGTILGRNSPSRARSSKAYLDWSLIDLSGVRLDKPNLVQTREMPDGIADGDAGSVSKSLVMPGSPFQCVGKRQPVLVLSGSEGLKRGSLSGLPSRLILGPGKNFVDTLIVDLEDGKRIVDGDSGSWVANVETLEVYGYVVAADAFGGGYVVPLLDAFRDIRHALRAKSVNLATATDLARTSRTFASAPTRSDAGSADSGYYTTGYSGS
ncbi:hypothetical protein ACJ41O_008821 [Fusarium nematophilum]